MFIIATDDRRVTPGVMAKRRTDVGIKIPTPFNAEYKHWSTLLRDGGLRYPRGKGIYLYIAMVEHFVQGEILFGGEQVCTFSFENDIVLPVINNTDLQGQWEIKIYYHQSLNEAVTYSVRTFDNFVLGTGETKVKGGIPQIV